MEKSKTAKEISKIEKLSKALQDKAAAIAELLGKAKFSDNNIDIKPEQT